MEMGPLMQMMLSEQHSFWVNRYLSNQLNKVSSMDITILLKLSELMLMGTDILAHQTLTCFQISLLEISARFLLERASSTLGLRFKSPLVVLMDTLAVMGM